MSFHVDHPVVMLMVPGSRGWSDRSGTILRKSPSKRRKWGPFYIRIRAWGHGGMVF